MASDDQPSENDGEAVAQNRLADRLDRIEVKLEKLTTPVVDEERRNAHPMQRRVSNAEKHWVTRLLLLGIALAAIWSFYEFREERKARSEERVARNEERIARAWQTLNNPIAGNSGKGEAINFLNSNEQELTSINLGGSANNRVRLAGIEGTILDVKKSDFSYADLERLDVGILFLEEVDLPSSYLNGTFAGRIRAIDARGAQISQKLHPNTGQNGLEIGESIFDNAHFSPQRGNIGPSTTYFVEKGFSQSTVSDDRIEFSESSLRCSVISNLHAAKYHFSNVNLSGAILDTTAWDLSPRETGYVPKRSASGEIITDLDGDAIPIAVYEQTNVDQVVLGKAVPLEEMFEGSWYFADNPPIGIPSNILSKVLEPRDRQSFINACNVHFPNGVTQNPNWNSRYETSALCASVEFSPGKCSYEDAQSSLLGSFQLRSARNVDDYSPEYDLGLRIILRMLP